MSEMTPADPTDDAIEPTSTTSVIKSQKDPENGTDSHVAGHGEDD
jgi:hypothetical protein